MPQRSILGTTGEGALAALFIVLAPLPAPAQPPTDPSFLLTATAQDFKHYFPGYLANGYFSTLTAPRGTEGNRGYMVALMERVAGDNARPAAMPGWTEIDYRAGPNGPWLNRAPLDAAHFRQYRQTLNLRDATLTTSYRYLAAGTRTAVEVTTFVSQDANHVAATRISLTPEADGPVTLRFGFNLWAPHQPRLPLARLGPDEVDEVVAAHGLTLLPQAPATPDRAAFWYPGTVDLDLLGADPGERTLWLEGRAEGGARMALAAAISLPDDIGPVEVRRDQNDWHLTLEIHATLRAGHSYRFGKFIAAERDGWGEPSADAARRAAEDARHAGFDALLAAHRAAWHRLWRSDIVIDGDPAAQRTIHADLYYLWASSTADTAWPIGACALTLGYQGHAFWDSDTWIFPALLLMHPQRARSLVDFRHRTLPAAQARARARGWAGAMYPWESDPDDGSEQTPHFAGVLGEREIHVNADIAIAQWQYYLASGDEAWLRERGWPVIEAVAQFWTSRSQFNPALQRYEILHVTSVDEDYNDVPNDTYTNAAAAKALRIATLAARQLHLPPDARWQAVADGLLLPFDAAAGHHLDMDAGVPHDLDSWGGSSLPMLALPSLDLARSAAVRRNDYDYAMQPIRDSRRDPNSMGYAPNSIAAAVAGNDAEAIAWFRRSLTTAAVKPPFNVRTESAENNAGYFVTSSAGAVQNLIYGFSGLRLEPGGLVPRYAPLLPGTWKSLTLKGLTVRGKRFDIVLRRGASGRVELRRVARPAGDAAAAPD
ncbi:MAG: glycoside hydrolase family 65 protein [Burkholderiales bacterium]|nr:hypothetical protein [Burkholderiales bacterium]MDE1926076.1 glycoside hydrolase family 65 protein [Burkholderiales bacterium]MDE2158174.1 glycoside hydrolase family 65 protein [Burkholderiales bacterium]MDE2502797.1 glycoside hydrolase family 65 protein [Burkholderiales bacterium]